MTYRYGKPAARGAMLVQNADYALLGAALGHQCDDSQISLFWLSREGRTALQVRAMEGRKSGVLPG